MPNFPGSLDSLSNPTSSTYTDDAGFQLDVVIGTLNDIAEQLEAELGAHTGAADTMPYVRRSDAAGAGLWVPDRSLTLLPALPNASFENWPEGTTLTSIANNTYSADGWIYAKVGAVVQDASRSTDVPAVALNAPLGNYSHLLTVTTADASIAAGDLCIISARVEGFDWLPYAQSQFTLSFWVKAAKTGTHCVALRNSGFDRAYVGTYTVNAANTWEYKAVVVSASPSAGTWNYTTGTGIEVAWVLSAGSTFQTTAGSWQTGNFLATSAQVNETDTNANAFRIFQPKLTLGPLAGVFTPLGPALNDLRARRHFRVWGGTGSTEVVAIGMCYSTTLAIFVVPLDPPMRATPSLAVSAAADWGVQLPAGTIVAATAVAIDPNATPSAAVIQATVAAGLTAGQAVRLIANSTANARLKLSARL